MDCEDKKIEVEINSIELPHTYKITTDGKSFPIDYKTAQQLHLLECVEREVHIDGSHKSHIAWQLICGILEALSTEDPTPVHFAIAREALTDEDIKIRDRNSKEYKNIVAQVASSLCDHSKKLKLYMAPPARLKEFFAKIADGTKNQPSILDITDCSGVLPDIDSYFEIKGMFLADNNYLNYMKKMGNGGKDIAADLKDMFSQIYKDYTLSVKSPLLFWFNLQATHDRPIFFSYAFIGLAKAIWRDEISSRANLITKVPAVTESDQGPIVALMSKKILISGSDIEEKKSIPIYSRGVLLGEISIPTIPTDAINATLKGFSRMNSVEAHKTWRYLPRIAFNQAAAGESDYRVIRRESFRDIASELNIKGESGIQNMTAAFHAMAHFDFKMPNFSGNLIVLRRFKSARTHRLDGVEITVGTSLLPYRACEDFKSGESNLMIPVLPDPPVVKSNQYHAGQYLLQMLVMGEFVRQSVDFAKHGHITIMQEMWQQMAEECNVFPILNIILDRWTQDGHDGPKLLQKLDRNLYKLGPSYEKEIDFLKRQGNHRMMQSSRGKSSALKRVSQK